MIRWALARIFRALRTILLEEFARDIWDVCPSAAALNYTNPMSILTGAFLRLGESGLSASVIRQVCADSLLRKAGMPQRVGRVQWKIAGINHQGWLLEIKDGGRICIPPSSAGSRPPWTASPAPARRKI